MNVFGHFVKPLTRSGTQAFSQASLIRIFFRSMGDRYVLASIEKGDRDLVIKMYAGYLLGGQMMLLRKKLRKAVDQMEWCLMTEISLAFMDCRRDISINKYSLLLVTKGKQT